MKEMTPSGYDSSITAAV